MKRSGKLIICLAGILLLAVPTTKGATNFFSVLYSGTRNDYTCTAGFEFVPSTNIVVSALGRPVSTSMTNNHAVSIWLVSDQSVVATVTVTPASLTDSLGYKYEILGSPVTLYKDMIYRIGSSEVAGGDRWRDMAGASLHSSIAVINGAVYGAGYPNNGGSGGLVYVAPTFYWSSENPHALGTVISIK